MRQYLTTQDIPVHCDAADMVGLLCLRKAASGGLSRIASSVSVFNELLRRRPDLAPRLFEPFMLDTRDESEANGLKVLPIAPCRHAGGVLRTFWHSQYFRTSQRHDGVHLTGAEHELLDLYDAISGSPEFHVDMDLQPGDLQLLSNHTVIHARTDYEDPSEEDRKRHLLRLWITFDEATKLHESDRAAPSDAGEPRSRDEQGSELSGVARTRSGARPPVGGRGLARRVF